MATRAIKTMTEGEMTWHLAVVDDDPALHRLVAEQLRQAGEPWHVTAYHSGAEALKGMTWTDKEESPQHINGGT